MKSFLWLVLAPLALAGCSAAEVEQVDVTAIETQLQQLGNAFGQYTADTGRPPKQPADLEKYLKPHGDPASFWKSPRDNQPLVVLWNVNLLTVDPSRPETIKVFIHEQQGIDGSRYVLLTDGSVREMTEAEFAAAPKAAS